MTTFLPRSRGYTLFVSAVLLLSGIFAPECRAQNYTWSAAANGNWSVPTNWTPNGTPGANDTVTFDATSLKNATVDANFSVQGLTMTAAYTGAIGFVAAANNTLAIGSGGFSQSNGVFDFTNSGGVSCASNLICTGATSTFICNMATVVLTFNEPAGTFTFTQPALHLGAIVHSGSGTVQCTDSFGVFTLGDFTQSGSGSFVTSAHDQFLLGNISVSAGTLDLHSSLNLFGGFGKGFSQTGGTFLAPSSYVMRGHFSRTGGTYTAGVGTLLVEPQNDDTFDSGGATFGGFTYSSTANLTLINNDVTCTGAFSMNGTTGQNGMFNCSGRNLTAGGAALINNGILNCGSGTVSFNGGLIIAGSTNTNNNTAEYGIVNQTTGTINLTDLTLNGSSVPSTGYGQLLLGSGAVNVSGNLSRPSGSNFPSVFSTGTTTFNFTKPSGTQTVDVGGTSFNIVNHTGAGTLSALNTSFTVTGLFTQSAGTFVANGQVAMFNGGATLTRPAGGICVVDAGTSFVFFANTLTMQGASITSTDPGAEYLSQSIVASNGPGGDKSAISGNTNLYGTTDNFDVAAGSELILSGTLSNGALTKSGAGILTLSAPTQKLINPTIVNGGTLVANTNFNADPINFPPGTMTINSGATLTGNGTVGPLTVANGGILTPLAGTGASSLTVAGNATISAGATFNFGLRGTTTGLIDKLFVQGTVNLDGSAISGTTNNFAAPVGTKFVIIDNDGTDAIGGKFSGQQEGSTVTLAGNRQFTISYKGGSGNDVELTALNTPPTINGSVSALPSTAGTGQLVTFSVMATDFNGDTLTYNWNFSDGTQASGASVTHAFTVPGQYTGTVSVSDGVAPAVTGSASVTVVGPVVGFGFDSDGDGFSDSFETVAGSNPNDATSTPTGQPITAGGLQPLAVTKLPIKLNFAKPTLNDSITVNGTLNVPKGFTLLNAPVIVDVGGVTKALKLGGKGSVKSGNDSFTLTVKSVKGVVQPAPAAKFTATFKKGTFAAALAASSNLANATVAASRTVVVTVIFNNTVYQVGKQVTYTATQGKGGSTK